VNHQSHAILNNFRTVPITRRSAIRTLALAGIALASVGSIGAATAQSQLYTVSTHSNFRAGPGTDYPVISVIPPGTTFTLNGQEQNNFYGVNHHGAGWVYAPLVVLAGDGNPGGDPVIVGEARTSTAVNLRSGPSTGHQVLRVVTSGDAIQVSNTVQNGFRYVAHQGLAGWMADQYIIWGTHQPPGATLTTTADLNLRAEPSLSAKILLVMPEGSVVAAMDAWSNGFRKVAYKGTTGWASTDYLN
jgi:uncharacterized protein YraI